MRINKERPAPNEGHSRKKNELSSYLDPSYKRIGRRAKSLREIPPARDNRFRVFPFMLMGLLEKTERENLFVCRSDIYVRHICDPEFFTHYTGRIYAAPTKTALLGYVKHSFIRTLSTASYGSGSELKTFRIG